LLVTKNAIDSRILIGWLAVYHDDQLPALEVLYRRRNKYDSKQEWVYLSTYLTRGKVKMAG
jgi:hypothetical protein